MKNSRKILSSLVVVLIILQLLVILLSWIVSAVLPAAPLRSMLSNGGIRWMFANFTDSLTSPVMVWIILYSMVWGTYRNSGLRQLSLHNLTFRKRLAFRTIIVETIIAVALLLMLTVVPHAVLLSISGTLITPEFFMGLLPLGALYILIISITYGSITRRYKTVSSITDSIAYGICSTSRIWVFYILIMLLVSSLEYVFTV